MNNLSYTNYSQLIKKHCNNVTLENEDKSSTSKYYDFGKYSKMELMLEKIIRYPSLENLSQFKISLDKKNK